MFENSVYLTGRDRAFLVAKNNTTGEDQLCVVNQMGNVRPITSLRYIKHDQSELGVSAQYYDEAGYACSYLSFADGREGIFLPADLSGVCYYVPWMGCYALQMNTGNKSGRRVVAGDYFYVFTDKKLHWLSGAIEAFNLNDASGNTLIAFEPEYGAYLSVDGNSLAIDEIRVKRGRVYITSGDTRIDAKIDESNARYGGFPTRATVHFNPHEILTSARD